MALVLKRRIDIVRGSSAVRAGQLRFASKRERVSGAAASEPLESGARRRRKRRRKAAYKTSVPKMVPTGHQMRDTVWQAVDRDGRLPSSLLILRADGSVRVWRYMVGSATNVVRLYDMENGTQQRVAAPNHKRPRQPPTGDESAVGSS